MKILNIASREATEQMGTADANEFFSLIRKANFIAIDSDHLYGLSTKTLGHNPASGELFISDAATAGVPISPPFACQWIELSHRHKESMMPSILFKGFKISPVGMLVNETAPGMYDVFMVASHEKEDSLFFEMSLSRDISGQSPGESNLHMTLATWMKAINSGALGVETGEDYVLLPKENGKKNKKAPHQIRRIIRIVPKKFKDTLEPLMNKGQIDFSHRWEVRGHWRKVPGIGKDREGNYFLRGLTWVSDCVKGPEEKPVIKKLRWIPGQERTG